MAPEEITQKLKPHKSELPASGVRRSAVSGSGARHIIRFLVALAAVFVGLIALVEALGYLTWRLSGAGAMPLPAVETVPAAQRHHAGAPVTHSVAEWPPERGRNFQDAPMLAARVKAGALPPVAERLPENPLVIVPPEQIGPYGGTWRRLATSAEDVRLGPGFRLGNEGLFRWDPMGKKLLPNLAWRCEIGDGGRSYTYRLRRGVRWSDGQPFTADDVVFWYEDVIKNPDLSPAFPADLESGGEMARLDKLDDYTVRFRFKDPHQLFLPKMSLFGAVPDNNDPYLPAHYLKQFHAKYTPKERLETMARARGLDFWDQLFLDECSSWNPEMPRLCPWIIKQAPPAIPAIYERNPYYWKVDPEGNQLPYIDRISFEIYDVETINLKAINGEVGMQSRHLLFKNYPLFMENRKSGGYRVYRWINSSGAAVVMAPNLNHKDPVLKKIFGDRRFRIALSHAMNRQEINEVVYYGVGTPHQPCPPADSPYSYPAYESAHVEYDPVLANRLLDEMGLDKRDAEGIRLRPDGKPLHISIEPFPTMGGDPAISELVAGYWQAVGIKAEAKLMARDLWATRQQSMAYDVTADEGGDEWNPLITPGWLFPCDPVQQPQGLAYGRWYASNGRQGEEPPPDMRRCMELYREIDRAPQEEQRIRLFREIAELNRQNCWVWGIVGDVPVIVLAKNNFHNVPEVAVFGWVFISPSNTAVECYSTEEK